MNREKIYLNASYAISLIYIFLGVIIHDWTYHMVPSIPGEKNARGIFIEIFLISYGLIIFTVSFLRARNRTKKLTLAALFYAGLSIIFVIGAFTSAADRSPEHSFLYNMGQFLSVALILYAPVLLLYLFNKKIGKTQ